MMNISVLDYAFVLHATDKDRTVLEKAMYLVQNLTQPVPPETAPFGKVVEKN